MARLTNETMRWALEQLAAVDPGERVRLQLHTASPLTLPPEPSGYGVVTARPEIRWGSADAPPEIAWSSVGAVVVDHVVVWDSAPEFGHSDRLIDEADETTSADSLDCSSSSGGRWSDLMARIDDLID